MDKFTQPVPSVSHRPLAIFCMPFLLTMEQTKKAGLETGVSSHMVLHNIIRVRKEENMICKAAKSSKGVMH